MNTFLSTIIERWPVDRLIPYARNARTHSDEQIEQIARSIREFGFTNPILVDTGAGILAGHARLLAARRVGLSQVPVIILDPATSLLKPRRMHTNAVTMPRWSPAGPRTTGVRLNLLPP